MFVYTKDSPLTLKGKLELNFMRMTEGYVASFWHQNKFWISFRDRSLNRNGKQGAANCVDSYNFYLHSKSDLYFRQAKCRHRTRMKVPGYSTIVCFAHVREVSNSTSGIWQMLFKTYRQKCHSESDESNKCLIIQYAVQQGYVRADLVLHTTTSS